MTANLYNISKYTRYNLDENDSDITIFIRNFSTRIRDQLHVEEQAHYTCTFTSFADEFRVKEEEDWLDDNEERFFKDTENETLVTLDFLSMCGSIFSMVYSPDGEYVVTGHATGMIQLRHGITGVVLCTLRNIQFPPKPIYALEFSKTEEKVCYAACMDGIVYRIEIPPMDIAPERSKGYCINVDPALESLKVQFYGTPMKNAYCSPLISQRPTAQALGVTSDSSKMVVGYGDTSIKVFDVETQKVNLTYKVHKLRLPFIPKKLQRMHFGQVCAVRTHPDRPSVFASAGWDNTARVWDIRCAVGCVMTFEGVNVVSDSIDLNRDQLITGSWQPTEALSQWDIVARKRVAIIRAQNRRADVDGEYIYACRFWRSSEYNRKGKYAIIGGSGTSCVEVINLHNRFITCSYPCLGNVLAIASHGERIAFGGSANIFHIVKFHDPKHEKDKYEAYIEPDYDYTCRAVTYSDEFESDLEMDIELLEQQEQEQTEDKISDTEVKSSGVIDKEKTEESIIGDQNLEKKSP